MQAIVKAKRIGGSIGVIIPKEIVEKKHIMENDTVEINVERKGNFNSLWSILKDVKIPIQKIMDITDEGEGFG